MMAMDDGLLWPHAIGNEALLIATEKIHHDVMIWSARAITYASTSCGIAESFLKTGDALLNCWYASGHWWMHYKLMKDIGTKRQLTDESYLPKTGMLNWDWNWNKRYDMVYNEASINPCMDYGYADRRQCSGFLMINSRISSLSRGATGDRDCCHRRTNRIQVNSTILCMIV